MGNDIRKMINNLKNFRISLNENSEILNTKDLSGKYESLYNFINDNNLQQKFVKDYGNEEPELNLENWEDYVRGELGYDEEIIGKLLGDEYKMYFDQENDLFVITKKPNKKNNSITITYTTDDNVIDLMYNEEIFTTYTPRFGIYADDKLIGGSTFKFKDGVYNFDAAIKKEFQGQGIFEKLIREIKLDAKKIGAKTIQAEIVNNLLFNVLHRYGFNTYKDGGTNYAYFKL